ncbi:hypothetical protein Trisim1_006267 [Trichoderma cf. simile WF8]
MDGEWDGMDGRTSHSIAGTHLNAWPGRPHPANSVSPNEFDAITPDSHSDDPSFVAFVLLSPDLVSPGS